MLKKIPGNVPEDSRECSKKFRDMLKEIQWECTRRFQGMFEKIPGNFQEDSGECSRGFQGMFKKIRGNLNLDLFYEILLIF